MSRHRRKENSYTLYNAITEPMLPSITAPIPRIALPRQSWIRRLFRAIGHFLAAILSMANHILALALTALLLLLFTRFILLFFGLTPNTNSSPFAQWVFLLSTPLVAPFGNLLLTLPYNGYIIDVTTLIAIVAYAIVVTLVRQFLKLFVRQR